jgi:hypothetical protein
MKLCDKTLKKMYVLEKDPYKMQDWGFRLRGTRKKKKGKSIKEE